MGTETINIRGQRSVAKIVAVYLLGVLKNGYEVVGDYNNADDVKTQVMVTQPDL